MKKVILTSEWLDQSHTGDTMKGRIVLLQEFDDQGAPIQFILTEQWEDSSRDNWENPKNPNYASGEYYDVGMIDLNNLLFDFYKRSGKLFGWFTRYHRRGELLEQFADSLSKIGLDNRDPIFDKVVKVFHQNIIGLL